MALRTELPQSPVTLLGYAVLKLTAGGNTGYVFYLMARPGRDDVARALLRGAVHHLRRLRVYSVRCRWLQSPSSPRSSDLWRLGFFLRSKRRSSPLVKFTVSALQETANALAVGRTAMVTEKRRRGLRRRYSLLKMLSVSRLPG